MARLILHPGADAEMREAAEWYEAAREGLGEEFVKAIEAAWDQIQRRPFIGVRVTPRHRRYLVRRFPYGIIYAAGKDAIHILAIGHLNRRPEYWRGRDVG